jgi:hypothetical protein
MTINEWFNNDGSYEDGILLYRALPNHNKNQLRIFLLKENFHNKTKLRYELQKNLQPTLKKSAKTTPIVVPVAPALLETESKYYRKVFIKDLPIALHSHYIQQKNDYNLACSLKLQLNKISITHDKAGTVVFDDEGHYVLKELTPFDKQKALKFSLEIMQLFKSINKTWEIIDFYLDHGRILETKTTNFAAFSETKIILIRNSRSSSKTRANAKLDTFLTQRKTTALKSFAIKLDIKIAKKQEHILQLKDDIITLDRLIHNNRNK